MAFKSGTYRALHNQLPLTDSNGDPADILTDVMGIFKPIFDSRKQILIEDIKAGLQISMLQQIGSNLMKTIGKYGKVRASSLPKNWIYTRTKIAGTDIPKYGGALETLIFAEDTNEVDNDPSADYSYSELSKRIGNLNHMSIDREVGGIVEKVGVSAISAALAEMDTKFDVQYKAFNNRKLYESKSAGVEIKATTGPKKIHIGGLTTSEGFEKLSRDADQIFKEDILGQSGGNKGAAERMQKYILFLSIFKLYEKMNTLLLIELEHPGNREGKRQDYIKFKAMNLFHELIFDKIAPAIVHGLVKIEVTVKDYSRKKTDAHLYSLGIGVSYEYDGLPAFLNLKNGISGLTDMMQHEKIRMAGLYKYDLTLYSRETGVRCYDAFFKAAIYELHKLKDQFIYVEKGISPRRMKRRGKKAKGK